MNSQNLCERYVYLVLLTPEKQFVRYIQNDLITFPMAVLFNRMQSLALKYLCLLDILLLNSIVLSRIVFDHFIFFWWRSHFTIICLRYFRIWRRGQKDCIVWETTTQLFVQNPLFRFVLSFLKYTRCTLYALFFCGGSTNWKGMWGSPRSCWKNLCANKVTYRMHLNEAL